jgi:hypothetical protein
MPCPHPCHLVCAAGSAKLPRDFCCPRCPAKTFLAKVIYSSINETPQLDLRKFNRDYLERLALARPPVNYERERLAKMMAFEDFSDGVETAMAKCDRLVLSDDVEQLLFLEYSNRKKSSNL